MNNNKNKLNNKKSWFFKPMPNAHLLVGILNKPPLDRLIPKFEFVMTTLLDG